MTDARKALGWLEDWMRDSLTGVARAHLATLRAALDRLETAEAKLAEAEAELRELRALEMNHEGACVRLKARVEALEKALRAAKSELGIPQPGYPAPVANACAIIDAALDAGRES